MYDPREEGVAPPKKLVPPLGWRVSTVVFVMVLLIGSLAPMGILAILYDGAGVSLGGNNEAQVVASTLLILIVIGIICINVESPKVFKIIFGILLLLAILNLGGCVSMLTQFSNIH